MTDPAMALLNHVTACVKCNPHSDKYCAEGKRLHIASNPSVDSKLVKTRKVSRAA